MNYFTRWADVPECLKTKTAIRQAGKRRRPKQPVIAQIDTTWGTHGGVYDLYDITDCLDARPISDERREQMRHAWSRCRRCGKRAATSTLNNGYCAACQQDRCVVARWAQHMVAQNAVVLDTETTGLTPGRILEIAIVDMAGAVLMHTLINPQQPIPADATAVHGITDEMVADAPSFDAVRKQVCDLLSHRPAVMYNAEFDTAFLRNEGVSIYEPYCLMRKFAIWRGERSGKHTYRWQSLGMACQLMDITFQPHRALADADAARRLLLKLAEVI